MPHIEIPLETVPPDQLIRLEHGTHGIVVLRTNGSIWAYHDECPHAQWRLSEGEIVDGLLECPGHGWQFEIDTGQCTDVPVYCLRAVIVTQLGDRVRFEWAEP